MAKSREFVGHTMVIGRTAAGKTLTGLFDEAQRIAGNPATKVFEPNAAASASDYSGLKLTDAEFAQIAGRKRGGR
ncbi:hypothetical protein G3A40_32545 [Paraburkholderia aspalathi]|uniref:hypothetical protein n=1 Tax=Paraburkholderia aspalathi TaxID=1324617 RepID=UPI00190CA2FB|nr:hypothetical protein [Paraburkholderia aspalathi]MBK3864504.1 hypothetical protein [Paraburkholderia aspalathi]